MRAYASLTRRGDFARVHRRGRRHPGRLLMCLIAEGARATRVGVTVSSEVGGAVVRNRLKRRLKALLDRYALGGPPFRDIVIVARPGAGDVPFLELEDEIERTFGPLP